jgi:RNA polymerase subunit RPABC4/transcription elongation factor Spt4
MPTFKHACPYCGKFIDKVSAACPFCGTPEPFSPKRCQNCRKIVEDAAWVVCPTCGASLTMVVTTAGAAGSTTPAAGAPATAPATAPAAPPATAAPAAPAPQASAPAPGGKCAGCGAPLPAGARFCTVCGTTAG